MRYLMLEHPGRSRVYGDAARGALLLELQTLLQAAGAAAETAAVTVCDVPYLAIDCPQPLSDAALAAAARASGCLALFAQAGDGLLRPVQLPPWRYLPEELPSLLKYPGKTNEQFTRLMVNLADSVRTTVSAVPVLLDPMCGSGTTLFEGAVHGFSCVGVEENAASVQRGTVFFEKYLQTGRYKHKKSQSRINVGGKRVGETAEFRYAAEKAQWDTDDSRSLTFHRGDSAAVCSGLKAGLADLLVCDLPYGVQHGSKNGGGLQRSALSLVETCLPGWHRLLKKGGALALAYNVFTTPRHRMLALLEQQGFAVCHDLSDGALEHRVDQAILRDVAVATRK